LSRELTLCNGGLEKSKLQVSGGMFTGLDVLDASHKADNFSCLFPIFVFQVQNYLSGHAFPIIASIEKALVNGTSAVVLWLVSSLAVT
jgi:hypothetical protein